MSIDGEENELPEGVATDRELARWERRNEVARRISDAMGMLGWRDPQGHCRDGGDDRGDAEAVPGAVASGTGPHRDGYDGGHPEGGAGGREGPPGPAGLAPGPAAARLTAALACRLRKRDLSAKWKQYQRLAARAAR